MPFHIYMPSCVNHSTLKVGAWAKGIDPLTRPIDEGSYMVLESPIPFAFIEILVRIVNMYLCREQHFRELFFLIPILNGVVSLPKLYETGNNHIRLITINHSYINIVFWWKIIKKCYKIFVYFSVTMRNSKHQ